VITMASHMRVRMGFCGCRLRLRIADTNNDGFVRVVTKDTVDQNMHEIAKSKLVVDAAMLESVEQDNRRWGKGHIDEAVVNITTVTEKTTAPRNTTNS
ncbi:hypothetical protein Tco_1268766, partial [Tanacetum coccineum]